MEMESLSISDIMWNLKSAFQEVSFKDAELALIKKEQQMKIEKGKIEAKYNGVLKENDDLKKQCDKLRRENKGEEELRRRALKDKFHVKKDLEGQVKEARKKIRVLEKANETVRERAEMAERREKEAREENARVSDKIKAMEEEKAETEGEIEKHLQMIGCLEKEKESALAEAENLKNIFRRFKERVSTITEDPGLDLSSTSQARLNPAYDGAYADMEDRLDTNIKEESNRQNSSTLPKLSGQNTNLSTPVSGKRTDTTIIDISDSDNDDGGVHPPNRLKRKRDLSGSARARVMDKNNDEKNITRKCKSEPPRDLSYGSVNHSLLAVASGYDQSASRFITAIKGSVENLAADASWQFEADMLSAFDSDPLLTMEAVCALYRQQKSRANLNSGSPFLKNRGFDGFHVLRGTALAEFLLNEDPRGGMKKSLEELQLHDPKGLDDCKRIAITHSRKLFEIYQMQGDPFFGPK